MPERYLVTGAAGFIGARLAQLLLDAGHQVVGVDSINNAYDQRLKHWRLDNLARNEGFRFAQLDLADAARTLDFVTTAAAEGGPFAAAVHLAARAGVRASVKMPQVYVEANVLGTVNVLEACRAASIKKFVLASSSSVYGDSAAAPFREDADTSRPLSPYAASKQAAEAMAYAFHRLHGIDCSIVRYFTAYGPAGRPDMSVFRFVRQIVEGDTIVVYGDGLQRRDFTFVDDLAHGTILALRPVGYQTFNLGSDHPVPLNEVLDKIARQTGKNANIRHTPADASEMPATWADITRARTELAWQPSTSLDDGLRQAIEWYLDNRAWASTLEL